MPVRIEPSSQIPDAGILTVITGIKRREMTRSDLFTRLVSMVKEDIRRRAAEFNRDHLCFWMMVPVCPMRLDVMLSRAFGAGTGSLLTG